MVLDDENLESTMLALRAMVRTTMQHTPKRLVFGQDSILNTNHKANW